MTDARAGLGKKLLRAFFGLLILLGATLGVFALLAQTKDYPVTGVVAQKGVRGVFHVHSTASDGRGDVQAIVQAAKQAGVQFVVLTDHNVEPGPPERIDGVLVIRAVELSTPYGHVVGLGMTRGMTKAERADRPLDRIHAQGGWAVLAHPVQKRNPWTDTRAAVQAEGFELFSGDSLYRAALRQPLKLACALGAYEANPAHALLTLVTPQPEATEVLLGLARQSPKIVLCAVDAHGLPPYADVFAGLVNHLPEVDALPDAPDAAAALVLGQLQAGRSVCAFPALGEPAGFQLATDRARFPRRVAVGEPVRVRLPPLGPAQARVVVQGDARLAPDGVTILPEKPGAFLVTVELLAPDCALGTTWRPWLAASPISVSAD